MSDVSEDGEISEPHDYIIDDDSLDIKPPQNQAGSKHKSGREKHSSERKRRDKHKHRRHESRRQRREHRERRAERSSDTSHRASEALHRDVPASLDAHEHRDREPHDALTHEASHDLLPPPARPSRSHERRESRRERRAERESRKAREQPPPVLESRGGYREAVDESAAPVRDSSRDGRHRAERRDAPVTEVDLRRERFLQAMRVSEHQKEMSRRELEARRHRREIEKQRQREQREIELKREREYSDDREGGERRKRSRRVIEVPDEAPDHSLESGDRTRESDRETREREPRDGRERESRADRQGREREPRDGRDREPREGREREPRENRERGARETRERDGRDREREYREGREREPREERTREREGRETDVREDRERLKKVESDHSSAEEEAEEEDEGGEEESEASSSSEEESGEESGDDNEEEEEEEGEDVTHVSPEGAAPQSRSPTPPVTGRRWRQTSRSSAENGASPRKRSPTHSSPPHSPLVLTAADSPPPSPVELKETLPPYLPAVSGCRNVEEFNCLNRIEEGTYGVVYRAVDKRTKEIVALKRLKMENEKEGFPITSLREINTLLKAQHENIVTVREIVVGSNMDKIYIVMDYVEHDLKSLMQTMKSKKQSFTTGEVKCLLLQMLRAVRHLHDNWILHRDLKTSNLLLSHKGILKVGDFGLAREYGSPLKPYTPVVVTLWYRAPELLLGVKEYACPIDMWSVGCIFGELVRMDPMFPGKSEADQINRIFKELGTPNEKIWPGYSELPAIKKMTFTEYPYNQLTTKLGGAVTDKGVTLMNKLLTYDPKRRLTAEDALGHSYFDEQPRPIEPSMFPTWPAKSEQTHKKAGGNSPKPPSGRKNLGDEDVGFQLGAAAGAGGFSLKF